MRIDIDFLGGSHGNFLEFVLNKVALGDGISQTTPFNSLGASHIKSAEYLKKQIFFGNHYSHPGWPDSSAANLISIRFNEDDLLPLALVSLLRAGDYNIAPETLEVDTYFKYNNANYFNLITELNKCFSSVQPYREIKAENWPDIEHVKDFDSLPQWIKRECIEDFNMKLFHLCETTPHCPRRILREFFKKGFLYPQRNGFWEHQERMQYLPEVKVFVFPFSAFYSENEFKIQIQKVFEFFQVPRTEYDLTTVHTEFLEKQKYMNAKHECDEIISKVISGIDEELPTLTVLHEAYIDAMLEKYSGKEMPVLHDSYFNTTREMHSYINEV